MAVEDWFDVDRYDEDEVVECKRCGKSGCHWEFEDTWVLMEGYQVHKCDEKRVHRDVVNDFEAL